MRDPLRAVPRWGPVMAAHVLFADMSQAGLHTMRRAVERGHAVTFVRGLTGQTYRADQSFRDLLSCLDRVVEIPDTSDLADLIEAIRVIHADRPVDAVISQCDPMLEALATACETLSLPYTSAAGIRNVRDKARARRLLDEAGLASARFAVVGDQASAVRAAGEIGYPVVVKPVSGLDSILASRADGPAAVAAAVAQIRAEAHRSTTSPQVRRLLSRGVLIEEYLAGELVSAEIGVRGGRTWRFLISGRSRGADNDCVEMGAVLPANVSPRQAKACFDYAQAVCRAVRLDFGVFHVEMMLTRRGPVLVEVNPRVMGGVMTLLYKLLTGTDFCDYVLDLHLGLDIRPAPPAGPRTITARRIMPRDDGRLPGRVDLGWLDHSATGIVNFENFTLEPGAQVRRQQVLGRFAVFGESWLSAMRQANGLVGRFEREIGIPLIQSAPVPAGGPPAGALTS